MVVFLNGEFMPLESARISPLDRGFLFGDGVYEVIPAYAGKLFRIDHHLQRLENSLSAIRMANPYSHSQWIEHLETLMSHQAHEHHSIYLQVTRGAAEKRDHAIPEGISPTVFMMSNPLAESPYNPDEPGVCTVTRHDDRWLHCDIKAITLLANILQRQEAVDEGCTETLLIKGDNLVEGAASNVFVIKDNVIMTPPKSPLLLPGVTRDLLLEIAAENNIAYREVDIPASEACSADEVWITSSTREILPVIKIDDCTIGEGKPGPLWHQMKQYFASYKQALISGKDSA